MKYPNNKNYLYHQGLLLLTALKQYVKMVEDAKMTDEQFYLLFEDSINELSVKDHNILYDSSLYNSLILKEEINK